MRASQKKPPRLIVPDVARGCALLGIAVANVSQTWIINDYAQPDALGSTLGGVRPDSVTDKVFAVLAALFVHVRGLPMFSTLLGFGIGLIAASLYRKNYPPNAARTVLVRRYLWLAAFGLIHMFALFWGDIMTAYGVIGVIVALMLTLSTQALRIVAYALLALSIASTSAIGRLDSGGAALGGIMQTAHLGSLAEYVRDNAMFSLFIAAGTPFSSFMLGGLVILGFVWAREGYLVDVDKHRRTLVTWTLVAAAVILVVGLPLGLSAIGVIDPSYEAALYYINSGFGLLTGPGILAAIALALNSVQQGMYRRFEETGEASAPAWTYPFVALGKRSMSGYIAQSVLFIALAMPFSLGLGVESSVTGKTAVGALVWLITLLLACALEAANLPGPFEKVHRRLAYGRAERIEPYQSPQSGPEQLP
ncbi:DUF418 domain-containing protein [Corynebacterium timonense]|uniref:Uncharacterized membrane protein YeiB n=1 Tax=Corynebacterium timonense TaxID=441500 RepID=A0A1H1RJE2_9CORY|nr:DUF418 domain-containing protein [Corynebacterium timonense]SDS35646.1 Uncharacterized membrane protein YeiB [Corynebacterium timonense]